MIPDYSNTTVLSDKESALNYRAAAREASGETVIAWTPSANQITVDMTKISGLQANAWWYNPDDNSSIFIGIYPTTGAENFSPPSSRKVLVLDSTDSNLAAPGTTTYTPPAPPTFTWTASDNVVYYYIHVDDVTGNRVARWLTPDQVGCASGGTCTYSPGVVLNRGEAQWRVLAWNPSGYSSWSATLLFAVP
jgi:hypothetical protein